jgi:hypothetical protein
MHIIPSLLALLLGAASPTPRDGNPVIDHKFPNPAAIRATDVFHYVSATQSVDAVGTANRPAGTFTDSGRPLQCDPGFENIDPMAFDDSSTGNHLKVQELASGSRPKPSLAPDKSDDSNEYRRLVEGAWIVRHGGYNYLLASGDDCCGAKAHDGVLVALGVHPSSGPRAAPANR